MIIEFLKPSTRLMVPQMPRASAAQTVMLPMFMGRCSIALDTKYWQYKNKLSGGALCGQSPWLGTKVTLPACFFLLSENPVTMVIWKRMLNWKTTGKILQLAIPYILNWLFIFVIILHVRKVTKIVTESSHITLTHFPPMYISIVHCQNWETDIGMLLSTKLQTLLGSKFFHWCPSSVPGSTLGI